MKTKAAESSNGVSVFKVSGKSEELQSPCAFPSTRRSKRKAENESRSSVRSGEKHRGISSAVDNALDHIVGQLDMLTLVSMQ